MASSVAPITAGATVIRAPGYQPTGQHAVRAQKTQRHVIKLSDPPPPRRGLSSAQCGSKSGTAIRCLQPASPEDIVVCFGEGLFDCLADQKGLPKDEVTSWTPYPGGAPANVAAALAKLSVKSAFISAMGSDDLGDQMLELLKGKFRRRVSQPTRDVLVTRDTSGDRTFAGFGKAANDQYADCFIDPDKLPEDLLKRASALVTGTLGLAFPTTNAAMHRAVHIAQKGSAVVMVDVNWRPVFWEGIDDPVSRIQEYVNQADVVKLSEEEAEFICGIPGNMALAHPQEVLEALPKAKGVLVTAGGLGSAYAFHGSGGKMAITGRTPVLKVEVVDTTGAGDAFLAGFLYWMVQAGGLSALQADADQLRKAVEFATACGGFTTQASGAIDAQPSLEEAQQLLATYESQVAAA